MSAGKVGMQFRRNINNADDEAPTKNLYELLIFISIIQMPLVKCVERWTPLSIKFYSSLCVYACDTLSAHKQHRTSFTCHDYGHYKNKKIHRAHNKKGPTAIVG